MLNVQIGSTSNWSTGGLGTITVTNTGSALANWKISFNATNFTITSVYEMALTVSGTLHTITGPSWAPGLSASQTISSGFNWSGSTPNFTISNPSANVSITLVNPSGPTGPSTGPTGPSTGPTGPSTGPTGPSTGPTGPSTGPTGPSTSAKEILLYSGEWTQYPPISYDVSTVPVQKITRLMYAFMTLNPSQADYNKLKANYAYPIAVYTPPPATPEGTLVPCDTYAFSINMPKFVQLKKNNPSLKIGVGIGGWTMSWNFSTVFANPTTTQNFVNSAVNVVKQYGLDELQLDWEYPGKLGQSYNTFDPVNDSINLTNAVKLLRQALDSQITDRHVELSAAVSVDQLVIDQYKGCVPYFDYIALMGYDMYGYSFSDGGHQAGLYRNPLQTTGDPTWTVDAAIKHLIATGWDASKILMGVPAYARGWGKLTPQADASIPPIFGKMQSVAPPVYSPGADPAMTFWKDIVTKFNVNGLNYAYDSAAQAPYLYNASTGEAWTFDDTKSIATKAKYILDNNLRGAMFWEAAQDVNITSPQSLINTMYNALRVSGPSGPATGPSGPATGPSGPATGPSGPATGPSGPATGPSGPATGPSGPATGPSGPNQPDNGPSGPTAPSQSCASLILSNVSSSDINIAPNQIIKSDNGQIGVINTGTTSITIPAKGVFIVK